MAARQGIYNCSVHHVAVQPKHAHTPGLNKHQPNSMSAVSMKQKISQLWQCSMHPYGQTRSCVSRPSNWITEAASVGPTCMRSTVSCARAAIGRCPTHVWNARMERWHGTRRSMQSVNHAHAIARMHPAALDTPQITAHQRTPRHRDISLFIAGGTVVLAADRQCCKWSNSTLVTANHCCCRLSCCRNATQFDTSHLHLHKNKDCTVTQQQPQAA